ncbi:D-ala-D-ala transporter subunit [compost metagenome]
MIGAGREVLRSYWYLTAIPGAFIVITVLSLNVLADRLNQMLNPQQRQHETERSHLVEEKA